MKNHRLDPRLPAGIFVGRGAPRVRRRPEPPEAFGVLPRGTVLEKYRIEGLLGTGGFGAVYRATHMLLESTFAIKHLRADVVRRRPQIVDELVAEARMAARIRHPNVVRVFDVGRTESLTYVVMELIEGGSLGEAIARRGRLSAIEVARIGIDVSEGLAAAHAGGLVHRDVKPANILLAEGGRACVADLGLARMTLAEEPASSRAGGGFVGTRGYASPEQLVDPERTDARADIYSLGVTLDEALRGRLRGPLDPDPFTRRLAHVIAHMTAHDRDDRPRDHAAVAGLLRELLAEDHLQ